MSEQVIATHFGDHVGLGDRGNVIECEPCGYKHIDPLPTPADIKAMYDEVFYAEIKPEYISKMRAEKPYWLALYKERIREMERLVPRLPTIVDVGCGPGYFMAAAKELGYEPTGIEPNIHALQHASAFGSVVGGFVEDDDVDFLPGIVMVHMSFILEHLIDPSAVLKKIHGWMPTGGVLCIELPRDDWGLQEEARRKVGATEWWVAPAEGHLNYFDSASLRSLVSRSGFSIQYETTTWPMEFFILGGRSYIGDDAVGKKAHEDRMALEMLMWERMPETKKVLYDHLAEQGIGREILLYCRREDA